jgi:hypothetical protein
MERSMIQRLRVPQNLAEVASAIVHLVEDHYAGEVEVTEFEHGNPPNDDWGAVIGLDFGWDDLIPMRSPRILIDTEGWSKNRELVMSAISVEKAKLLKDGKLKLVEVEVEEDPPLPPPTDPVGEFKLKPKPIEYTAPSGAWADENQIDFAARIRRDLTLFLMDKFGVAGIETHVCDDHSAWILVYPDENHDNSWSSEPTLRIELIPPWSDFSRTRAQCKAARIKPTLSAPVTGDAPNGSPLTQLKTKILDSLFELESAGVTVSDFSVGSDETTVFPLDVDGVPYVLTINPKNQGESHEG